MSPTDDLRGNIAAFLKHAGDSGVCRGCGVKIYWFRHHNGKLVPYEEDLTNHFARCPQAQQFKKEKKLTGP